MDVLLGVCDARPSDARADARAALGEADLGRITLRVEWGSLLPARLRHGPPRLWPGEELLVPGGVSAGWLPRGAVDDDGFRVGGFELEVQLLAFETEGHAIVAASFQ